MSTALTEFIQILTGGIVSVASSVGSGLQTLVTDVFLVTDATSHQVTGLSAFGGVIAIFAGISLAIGLCSLVVHWVMHIGK